MYSELNPGHKYNFRGGYEEVTLHNNYVVRNSSVVQIQGRLGRHKAELSETDLFFHVLLCLFVCLFVCLFE